MTAACTQAYPQTWRALLCALLTLLLAGCASVSVTDEQLNLGQRPAQEPPAIWVRDFGYKLTRNQTRTYGPELKPFLDAQVSELTVGTVAALRRSGFRTAGLGRRQPLPRTGWLVAGNITWLDVGNRWMRTGVGFGEGATRIDTEVLVFDLAQVSRSGRLPPPFYGFRTTGGSGIAPGLGPSLVVTGIVTPMTVVGGTLKVNADLTADNKRTSRMISGALQDYLADNNLIPRERQRQHAKRLGVPAGATYDDFESDLLQYDAVR